MAVSSVIVVSGERVSGTDELALKNVTICPTQACTTPFQNAQFFEIHVSIYLSLICYDKSNVGYIHQQPRASRTSGADRSNKL